MDYLDYRVVCLFSLAFFGGPEMASLAKKDVKCSEVEEARWGSITKMRLPGGGAVGLYQPKHPLAISLK